MKKCLYCGVEISASAVLDVCQKCGVKVFGEKMFETIKNNMGEANERDDLCGTLQDPFRDIKPKFS